MTTADLDAVIARTGHERFRSLTSDDNPDVAQRDAYRRLVAELAASEGEPTRPLRRDPPPSDDQHVGCCGGMPY